MKSSLILIYVFSYLSVIKAQTLDTSYFFHNTQMSMGYYICTPPKTFAKTNKDSLPYFKISTNSVCKSFNQYKYGRITEPFKNDTSPICFLEDSISNSKDIIPYNQWFPVLLFNFSEDTIELKQQDSYIIAIQEAKNKLGEWKPIEYWHYSWCHYSYSLVPLPPNNYVALLCPRYDGDFSTQLRIRIKTTKGVLVSPTYNGTINKKQFKKPGKDPYISYLDK